MMQCQVYKICPHWESHIPPDLPFISQATYWRGWKKRNAYRDFVEKPEGKRPLRRLRCRWECDIKIEFKVTGLEDVNWINVAEFTDE
jgi:hypothetical protein